MALLSALIAAPAHGADHTSAWSPAAPSTVAVKGVRNLKPKVAQQTAKTQQTYMPRATAWPKAAKGSAHLAAPAAKADGARQTAAGTPIWVQAKKSATGTYQGPADVGVTVLDHQKSAGLGVSGVVFSVAPSGNGQGGVRIGVDYSSFAEAYGGNYASRLHLVSLPACALTTPDVPSCRVQTPLATQRDAKASTVSAEVELGTPAVTHTAADATMGRAVPAVWSGDGTTAHQASTAAAPQVLAATDSTGQEGSAAGSYAAGALSPSGSWTAGGAGGSFTYAYPVQIPGASTSLTPKFALGYDSASVDGKTASTQAQASWVGDGWSTPDSFIEQTFTSCADKPEGTASPSETSDECYAGPILTLSLNGSSTALVWDSAKSTWKPQSDNGEKIAHVTNSNNGSGTYNTDYWTVTDRTGTVYSFGRNQLPGWTSGKAVTNSVDSMPVYSAHSGDPCYNAAGFSSSVCTMAYKWHLDYVKDARSQAMSYWYTQDTNYYAQNNGQSNTKYVRDSYLARIDYGFRDSGAYGTVPDQIAFTPGSRCTLATCDPISGSNAGTQYPDVPFDLICNSGATCTSHAPAFFSTVRLKQITTSQYSTSAAKYLPVDTYDLLQSEPPTGDGTSPTLWLTQVTRTGNDTSAGGSSSSIPLPLPPVVFGGDTKQNRVDTANFPGMYRYRLTSITTELGELIGVTYGLPNPCTAAYVAAANPATNTSSCYPVSWTPPFYTDPVTDWFEKYAVTQVLESDQTGGALKKDSTYAYTGGAAWHYDDNETVQAKYRTWGQFRGYATVTTYTGDGTNDRKTKDTVSYYRGMDGDYATVNPVTIRPVSLTDSQGAAHTDSDKLSGSELESTSYKGDGTVIDSLTITSYWVSPATATRNRTGLPALTAGTAKEAETYTRQAITSSGSTTWRVTETDNTYVADLADNNFGLLTAGYSHTVPVVAAYDQCTTYTYAPANTTLNLVGLAASQESDSVACGGFTEGTIASAPAGYNTLTAPASVNRPAQVQSATRTFYDDTNFSTTFPQTTPPTVGNATMIRQAADYASGAFTWQTAKRTTYDTYGRPLAATDANGNTTITAYTVNSVGLTTGTTITNAKNQMVKTTFAPARGLTTAATDANNITATSQSDALGRLTGVWTESRPTTAPANKKFSYTVSNTGLSGTTSDTLNEALGYVTSLTVYDSFGRVRQTQTPTPQGGRLVTESFFDSRGWVRKKNNAYWDPANTPALELASSDDNAVPSQDVTTYDGLGRAVKVDSLKNAVVQETTTTVYGGDRTTVIPPAGGTVKATVTDPLGRTVELDDYTARPTVTPPADTFTGTYTLTGGTSQAITYGFDGHGKQNTVTAAGSTWTSTYNLLGQVTGKNDPDAGASSMLYDAVGNLTQTTDSRTKTVSYTYDKLNRKTATYTAPVSGQATANAIASWVYDNDNSVVGVTNPIGHATTSTSYSNGAAYVTQASGYNVFGESLGETITIPSTTEGATLGKPYVFTHTYTSNAGLPYTDVYPGGNGLPSETALHTYKPVFDLPAGLATASYGYAQDTTYDAYSRVLQTQIGSTTSYGILTNTYDPHTGRLTEQLTQRATTGAPSDVDRQHYYYDQAGNVTRQVSTRLGATSETQCYGYDQLDRLKQAWTATDSCAATPTPAAHSTVGDAITGGAYWTDWSFDALGNRTNQTEHSTTGGADTTTTYTYNGNGKNQPHTLTSASTGGTALQYDTAGNALKRTTTAAGTQTLTWDDAGRLSSITGGTAGNTNYVYDADGNVLLQKDPGTTTLYLPGQQIALNTTLGTTTSTRYLPLPGGGTVVRTGSTTNYRFEIADPHGTAGLVLDNTCQTPTWRQFTPYGAPRGTSVTWPDNRGFLNAPTSGSTGLTILGARQYDPVTGRFISLDPVFEATDAQQLGGYNYAGSNPIGRSDPTGLMAWDSETGISAGTTGQLQNQINNTYGHGYRPSPPYSPPKKKKRGFWKGVMDTGVGMVKGAAQPFVEVGGCVTGDLGSCGNVATMANPGLLAMKAGVDLYHTGEAMYDEYQNGEYAYLGGQITTLAAVALITKKVAPVPAAGAAAAADAEEISAASRLAETVGGKCSFTPETAVLMSDGTTKPIAAIIPGDQVEAADPGTAKDQGAHPVIATWINHDNDLIDLSVQPDGGSPETIHTTSKHRFWDDTTHEWVPAGQLTAGHNLVTTTDQHVTVLDVSIKPGSADMYNLTVDSLHTYYVLAGATPVLVHNCGPGVATEDDAMLALNRAEELQASRNDYFMADVKGTTAVIGVFNSETKAFTTRIGINGGGAMPSGWTLRPGEEFVQAAGHAEEGILNSLGPNEHAVFGAASRNFCVAICSPMLNVRGVTLGGAGIRGHAAQNSPFTIFWATGG
ncbi:polymorphic toxin-type HINT domain-containing protein [Kitasatospora atroaurantiaca]|uniref:polymorphic toxin-type HINT domain-containing protein n=1 Tax=Kitasatospora atroaurantiaca TaxID=285545 RepID=UPI0011A6A6B5|nr:polymorphic toxin-type HINT domain-containing protein [Kitasatospora atroaurantiaca]